MRCPCCGQDTDRIVAPEHLMKVVLPPIERQVLRLLIDCYPHGLTRAEVVQATSMSRNHVSVAMWSIRKKIRNYVENRRAVQELSALSDHALSDIGLARSQIRSAVLGR